jgi:circadian clock protein KaiB
MITPRESTHDATLEPARDGPADGELAAFGLTLFVSGASDLSSRAIANATSLCEKHLAGRYELSIVDLEDEPEAASESHVLAAPTLVRNRPPPVRMVVGDLSQTARVLRTLELSRADEPSTRG